VPHAVRVEARTPVTHTDQPMNKDRLSTHIHARIDEHIDHVRSWIRQPSVSVDGGDLRAMAEHAAESFRRLGCQEVEVLEGRYHPGVWAHLDVGAPVTVHVYAMLDTPPAGPGWSFDPWGGELAALDGYGTVLVGRGAMTAKGPFVAFLNALESVLATEGTIPANVAFLAESEEVLASPSYAGFVERYTDTLRGVSASYCPSPARSGHDVWVGLGLKSMVIMELSVAGGDLPGASVVPVRAAAAGLVRSPAHRLIHALASLTDASGRGSQLPLLDWSAEATQQLTPDQRQALEGLEASLAAHDPRQILPVGGMSAIEPLPGEHPLRDMLLRPSLHISGIRSGYLGPGTGTMPFSVPTDARATLEVRSFGSPRPHETVAAVRAHLDEAGFDEVRIEVVASHPHHASDPTHRIVDAATQTLLSWSYNPRLWPLQAGAGAWSVVPATFGVPCIRGCLPTTGRSGADEYLVIESDDRELGLAALELFHAELFEATASALRRMPAGSGSPS